MVTMRKNIRDLQLVIVLTGVAEIEIISSWPNKKILLVGQNDVCDLLMFFKYLFVKLLLKLLIKTKLSKITVAMKHKYANKGKNDKKILK